MCDLFCFGRCHKEDDFEQEEQDNLNKEKHVNEVQFGKEDFILGSQDVFFQQKGFVFDQE